MKKILKIWKLKKSALTIFQEFLNEPRVIIDYMDILDILNTFEMVCKAFKVACEESIKTRKYAKFSVHRFLFCHPTESLLVKFLRCPNFVGELCIKYSFERDFGEAFALLALSDNIKLKTWVDFIGGEGNIMSFCAIERKHDCVKNLLSSGKFDPNDENFFLIEHASETGDLKLLEIVLEDNRVDPSTDDNYPIRASCESGHLRIVKRLLQDKRVDVTVRKNYPFRIACQNNKMNVVKYLLKYNKKKKVINTRDVDNYAFVKACEGNHYEMVELLAKFNAVDVEYNDNYCFFHCIEKGFVDTIRILLKYIDPTVKNNKAVSMAVEAGNCELLMFLLTDERVDPSDNKNHCIKFAFSQNDENAYFNVGEKFKFYEIIKLLLTDKRVDPSVDDQFCLGKSIENKWEEKNQLEIIKLLLKKKEVIPNLSLLRKAVIKKLLVIVKLFLKKKKLDPSGNNNEIIVVAAKIGSLDILKALLKDKRVDPSDRDNLAIFSSKNDEIALFLLKDKRVDSSLDKYKLLKHICVKGVMFSVAKKLLEDKKLDTSQNDYELIKITLRNKHTGLSGLLSKREKYFNEKGDNLKCLVSIDRNSRLVLYHQFKLKDLHAKKQNYVATAKKFLKENDKVQAKENLVMGKREQKRIEKTRKDIVFLKGIIIQYQKKLGVRKK